MNTDSSIESPFPAKIAPSLLFIALPLVQGCQAAISLWGNLAMLAFTVGIFLATVLFRTPS